MRPSLPVLVSATVISLCMDGFALTSHDARLVALRLACAAGVMITLAMMIAHTRGVLALFGVKSIPVARLVLVVPCVLFGLALGCFYRDFSGMTLWPGEFHAFVFVAASIGIGEELLYRGVIQGCLGGFSPVTAAFLASAAHTLYKCCLFVFPGNGHTVNLLTLGGFTFGVGLLMGFMRHAGNAVLPAGTHAAFDVVTYGDAAIAPWWVG